MHMYTHDLDDISLSIVREGVGVRRFELTTKFETPVFCDTKDAFNSWFYRATYNDKRIYYTGVALSATMAGKVIGNHLYELYKKGHVHLLQQKIYIQNKSDPVFNYLAYRTKTLVRN